jgi:hypothetical protein
MGATVKNWQRSCTIPAAALMLGIFATGADAATEKVIRVPTQTWHTELSENQSRLTMVNKTRVAAIEMRIGDRLPDDSDIRKLVERLTGQSSYRVRGRWPQATLTETSVQLGVSIAMSDGRKGMFAAIWKRRTDGRYGMVSYLAIATEYSAQNIADFDMVRSMGNQLKRGAVLVRSPQLVSAPVAIAAATPAAPLTPTTSAAVVSGPAIVSPLPVGTAAPPVIIAASLPPPSLPVVIPVPIPAPVVPPVAVAVPPVPIITPVIAPVASPVVLPAAVAIPVPAVIAAHGYPFVAAAGAGVSLNQIASLLYAPFESSEVFVLFKDGSFHENLPVALEEWNAGASRRGDPSSWGKWKNAEEADEFELAYAEDDVVTIAARKIKPAKAGMVLEGSYGIENGTESPNAEQVEFTGNRFEITRKGAVLKGGYRIDGYSLILNFDDGRSEHRPFFVVPPEEDGDDPSIWLGDALHVRVD